MGYNPAVEVGASLFDAGDRIKDEPNALFWCRNDRPFSAVVKVPNVLLRMKEDYDGVEPSPIFRLYPRVDYLEHH